MNYLKNLSTPLPINSIDFRIQSINKGGYATILAYKDARVDMQVLDDVVGAYNWKRAHTRDNKNCIVSIWDEEKKQWVSKEDTGTESYTEKDKGLASDSFKRACFNWGIGRELYDYPIIQVKLNPDEFTLDSSGKAKATYNLKIKTWVWESMFFENKLCFLKAIDLSNKTRFCFDNRKPKLTEKQFDSSLSGTKNQIETVIRKYDLTEKQRKELSNQLKKLS